MKAAKVSRSHQFRSPLQDLNDLRPSTLYCGGGPSLPLRAHLARESVRTIISRRGETDSLGMWPTCRLHRLWWMLIKARRHCKWIRADGWCEWMDFWLRWLPCQPVTHWKDLWQYYYRCWGDRVLQVLVFALCSVPTVRRQTHLSYRDSVIQAYRMLSPARIRYVTAHSPRPSLLRRMTSCREKRVWRNLR